MLTFKTILNRVDKEQTAMNNSQKVHNPCSAMYKTNKMKNKNRYPR